MSIESSESYNKIDTIPTHEFVDYISKEIESGKNPDTFPEFIRDLKENPLTANDLFELLRVPGEIGLSDERGKVILTIGIPGRINNEKFIQRSQKQVMFPFTHSKRRYELGIIDFSWRYYQGKF